MLEPTPGEVICRHWLGLVLIGVLSVMLLPAWGLDASFFSVDASGQHAEAGDTFARTLGQLASFHLLVAMAFWVALRRGAVDLSVWAVSGLGGLVSASLINAGLPVGSALALAVGAGLAVGAVNGLVTAWTRLSSPAFTLIVAAVIVAAAGLLCSERALRVPDDTFSAIVPADEPDADPGRAARAATPLSSRKLRMLLVAVVYSAGMVVLLCWGMASRRRHWSAPDRAGTFAAMAASGALSAAAGAFWLVDHGSAPLPTRLVGDLRVPAAAILAGGMLWLGPGRTLLSGLFLPVSVLLATAWRQEVTAVAPLRGSGYAGQLLLLTAMLCSAHLALLGRLRGRGVRRAVGGAALVLIVLAVAGTASQALMDSYAAKRAIASGCLLLWAVAAAGAVIAAPWSHLIAGRTARYSA